MKLTPLGAVGEVTGSMHLLRAGGGTILLDCGLYQGRRMEALQRNRHLPLRASDIDAVVLSHAHIDHSGALPLLVKSGYRGPIYLTPATRDLCAVMLEDAALIQEQDAAYLNRRNEREGLDEPEVTPLYTEQDVVRTLDQMVEVPYGRNQPIVKDVSLQFRDAGHVLGSALVQLDVDEDGAERRFLFTGDLGRRERPILRDPECPSRVSVLLTESTYGGRTHPESSKLYEELAATIVRTHARGGKVIIPSFALERAQEVMFCLKRLLRDGRIPSLPVYVDSPLTTRVTEVFRLHPECYDEQARHVLESSDSPFEFPELQYVADVDASKALDKDGPPCVIIAASGMCEFGRVVHHLRAHIGDPRHSVVIVGFQAQHTLGRRLVEGRRQVFIFGMKRDRNCEVVVLNGFSAHADHDDLVAFAEGVRERGPLRTVILVHGEDPARNALASALRERGFPDVRMPAQPGEELDL